MNSQKLYFFAPLGNVDESVLKIKLSQEYQIDSMSRDDGFAFISQLEKIPKDEIARWAHYHTVFVKNSKLYYIKKTFNFDLPINEYGYPVFTSELHNLINNFVEKQIKNPISLLHLYKEGYIHQPCWYIYFLKNEIPTPLLASGSPAQYLQPLFHLDNAEINEASEFISKTKLPFNFDYLTLAHENFELSYTVLNSSLSFLSLMIASEVLFNPGPGEITQRISRNFAVLLGNSTDDAKKIQKEIKELYKKRSALIHNGKAIWTFVDDDIDDVTKIRQYVREAMKKIIMMNLPKDELHDLLNSKGFGQLVSK
jgi:hypothetical protein